MGIFTKISGFDPPIIDRLEKRERQSLEISSGWVICGIALSSFSAGYMFYYCMNSILAGIVVCAFTFLFLLGLQVVLISGTLGNVNLEDSEFEGLRSNKSRFGLLILLALLLSQPLLLLSYNYFFPEELAKQIKEEKELKRTFLQRSLDRKVEALEREISYHKELVNQLSDKQKPIGLVESKDKEAVFLSNTRKALLIGNQSYPSSPLNNPIKDVRDIANKLTKIGFSVKTIVDGDQFLMEKGLVDYYNTLRPGDISLIYYSGHGFQDHGNNYLVPVDFDLLDKSRAVSLNVIVEAISKHALLANILIIDACRNFSFGKSGGLASTEAGVNTYLAMSAKPGQFSLDGEPGTNGIFTAAILKNIDKKVDIDTLFRDVRRDVLKKSNNKQETWTSHNLNGTLVLAGRGVIDLASALKVEDKRNVDISGISCNQIDENAKDEDKRSQLIVCSTSKILALKDALLIKQAHRMKSLSDFENKNSKELISRGEVLNIFYSITKHPAFSIFGTLVITFMLAGGLAWRHFFGKQFKVYERLFHQMQKVRVIEAANKYMRIAEKLPYANKDFVRKSFTINFAESRPSGKDVIRGKDAKDFVLRTFS